MSGTDAPQPESLKQAILRRRKRFSLIWLVPIIAVGISIYLAVEFLLNQGPLITITLNTANGITPQQTLVEHKAVNLGMVEDVHLSQDLSHAVVHVRMNRQGERVLTNHARFWVVRPRFTPGNSSGLETLVSGAYIEVDPGPPGGDPQYDFRGLEDPPGVRSDEPGTTYAVRAGKLGSIGPGTPIFYRDIVVGEVLSYDLGDGLGPITIKLFIKSPFDKFVHDASHFWNTSGVTVSFGAQGLHVELQSIQALLSGGIAFNSPKFSEGQPRSPAGHVFRLFASESDADNAGYTNNIEMVTYFTSSVSGLSRGSPVEIFGLPIGTVTDVSLAGDPRGGGPMRARVAFNLQPERVFPPRRLHADDDPVQITRHLVSQGMRAVLESSSFITGQKAIALEFVPNATASDIGQEGDVIVLPSQNGGLDNITNSLSDIATKLDKIPFEDIGKNLNKALASISDTVSSPDVKTALHRLADTLSDIQNLVRHTDAGLKPVLQKLPRMSDDLQQTLTHLNAMLGENGYGGNSDFQRNVSRLLDQVNETARSIRLLVDFLDRHPEALLRGRTGASEK
jgi:paraquat-inducible protein B